MSLDEHLRKVLATLPSGLWLSDVDRLLAAASELRRPGIEPIRELIGAAGSAIHRSQRGRSQNLLALALATSETRSLELIRRDGVLRASKLEHRSEAPLFAVAAVLENSGGLGLHPSTVHYLVSTKALLEASIYVRNAQELLVERMRSHSHRTMRALLVTLEALFFQDACCPERLLSTTGHHSKEDLAEGFSFLWHLFDARIGLRSEHVAYLDWQDVASGKHLAMLEEAAGIRRFAEFELWVDAFGYSCSFEPQSKTLTLTPASDLEQSIRLGYIAVSDRQAAAQARSSKQSDDVLTYEYAGRDLYRILKATHVHRADFPLPRYVFRLPMAPPLEEMIKNDALFFEEITHYDYLVAEHLLPWNELERLEVAPAVTIQDLRRTTRLLNLLRQYVAGHLIANLDDPEAIIHSFVPAFKRSALIEFLSLATAEPAALLEQLEWRTGLARTFDVQYSPLLSLSEEVLLPVNVAASSDTLRNSLQLLGTRFHRDTGGDPLSAPLADALLESGFRAGSNVKVKHALLSGDIDAWAFHDNRLFLFECKYSLHPCNVFELRNTLAHVRKATRQLTRLRSAFQDAAFRSYLSERLALPLSESTTLETCIVLGTPMFFGLEYGGHSVRSFLELVGFLSTHEVKILGQPIALREPGAPSGADLSRYLSSSSIHDVLRRALRPRMSRYTCGELKLLTNTFYLHPIELANSLEIPVPPEILDAFSEPVEMDE